MFVTARWHLKGSLVIIDCVVMCVGGCMSVAVKRHLKGSPVIEYVVMCVGGCMFVAVKQHLKGSPDKDACWPERVENVPCLHSVVELQITTKNPSPATSPSLSKHNRSSSV